MPGMELTMPQAIRLLNLGADDCRHVLDSLVDAGFLRWTPRKTVIRTGRNLQIDGAWLSHKPVRSARRHDKSV